MLERYPFKPGVIKDDTVYASSGYAVDSDKVRWIRGRAEAWPGWQIDTDDQVQGACRAGRAWAANDGTRYWAFGTNSKLYAYLNTRLYDITPVTPGTVTLGANPLTVFAGSSTVRVTQAAHQEKIGNTLYIGGATPVAGLQIGGTSGSMASDPFQTTDGSAMVLVIDPAHGLRSGDFITFAGATPVAGITIDGRYSVSVYDADFYSVQADTKATASTAGGGVPTFVAEKGYVVIAVPDASHFDIEFGVVPGSTASGGGAAVTIRHELTVGNRHGIGSGGYGLGGYGEGPYGIFFAGSPDSEPRIWCLQNYGEFLTANPIGGRLYQWELNVSQRAEGIANSPLQNNWHVVTAERVMMAMGCTSTSSVFDPMLMRWCDIQNNTIWLPADDNNAGDERLSEGSRIIAGTNTRGGILVWTDTSLYYTRYTGQSDSQYASDLMGTSCGLMGPNAFIEHTGSAFWVDRAAAFHTWSGGAPSTVQSPMRRWFSERLSIGQQYEVFAFYDAANPAVSWLFPATPSLECNEYLRVDLPENQADPNAGWSNGTFDRTMWVDLGIFEFPIAISSDGRIYRQNVGTSDNGNAIQRHVEYGVLEAGDGNLTIVLSRAVFDCEIFSGALQLVFGARKWPNGPESVKGPYNLLASTQKTDMRVKGRQITVTAQSLGTNDGWRVGAPRYDISGSTLR